MGNLRNLRLIRELWNGGRSGVLTVRVEGSAAREIWVSQGSAVRDTDPALLRQALTGGDVRFGLALPAGNGDPQLTARVFLEVAAPVADELEAALPAGAILRPTTMGRVVAPGMSPGLQSALMRPEFGMDAALRQGWATRNELLAMAFLGLIQVDRQVAAQLVDEAPVVLLDDDEMDTAGASLNPVPVVAEWGDGGPTAVSHGALESVDETGDEEVLELFLDDDEEVRDEASLANGTIGARPTPLATAAPARDMADTSGERSFLDMIQLDLIARAREELEEGRREDAIETLERALGLRQDNPQVLAMLAWALVRGPSGRQADPLQFERAQLLVDQARQRAPTDASVQHLCTQVSLHICMTTGGQL